MTQHSLASTSISYDSPIGLSTDIVLNSYYVGVSVILYGKITYLNVNFNLNTNLRIYCLFPVVDAIWVQLYVRFHCVTPDIFHWFSLVNLNTAHYSFPIAYFFTKQLLFVKWSLYYRAISSLWGKGISNRLTLAWVYRCVWMQELYHALETSV